MLSNDKGTVHNEDTRVHIHNNSYEYPSTNETASTFIQGKAQLYKESYTEGIFIEILTTFSP